jgi:hypothetical protein
MVRLGFAKIAIKAIGWIFRISPAINVLLVIE